MNQNEKIEIKFIDINSIQHLIITTLIVNQTPTRYKNNIDIIYCIL